LRPEAREAARTAARRSRMSVGEWLNNVIAPDDEDDDQPAYAPDYDDETEDAPPRRRERPREPRGDRSARSDHDERRRPPRDGEFDRDSARTRDELNEVNTRLDRLSHQLERMARSETAARRPPPASTAPPPQPRRRPPFNGDASDAPNGRLTGAPAPPRRAAERPPAAPAPARHQPPAGAGPGDNTSIDDAVAEIAARQRVLDGDAAPELMVHDAPAPMPMSASMSAPVSVPEPAHEPPHDAPAQPFHDFLEPPVVDISGLDQQLRLITARIEALRPSSDLEAAVAAIRSDLTEIARLITEALPRRAVESLEIEVKALAQRIEHSRQCGVDTGAIAGLERGLSEVRDALRALTPAENLVGFDEAVRALSQKVDMIVAKDDPAALQQLETAIGALRGIVSHVASNETLTKVAEDVRSLAAKIDGLANDAASSAGLSAIEHRIESLASALSASTEAGQSVPRELEKLLTGLIEKLEWVQLTHTDHAALAHLEDRIATLVQRFDSSDARLNHLEAIERGIADLLVHIDQIRGFGGDGASAPPLAAQNPVSAAIERDVAAIRQSELRTQDSLEAVQGTVEHVVDRLAMIESGFRDQASYPTDPPAPLPHPAAVTEPKPTPPTFASEPAALASAPAVASMTAPIEPLMHRAAPRQPIDPDLPPDHPLEPGSTSARSRPSASAADRIAASEAAVNSGKPPVIADPGQKSNFIAAARRAAQAAAASAANDTAGKGAGGPNKTRQRTRPLILAGAAALIVIGCLQIAAHMFEGGGTPIAPPPEPEKTAPPISALPQPDPSAESQPAAIPAPAPLPLPSTTPNTLPGPAASPKTGANVSAKATRQAAVPPIDAVAAATAAATANDITGSLPHPTASTSAPLGDKLPAAIGGPALRAAALSGDGAAAYEVGMRFAEGRGVPRSNEEAALWLERAAKQGLAPAQFRLGGFYEKGLGVKKNLATARDFYLAAANKGNGKAMHNLAVLYAEGIDGPADYSNAGHWFREAADHGITDSQYNLGILYARGVGVAQNYAESYKWFALAAIAGDQDAVKKGDEVASHLDQQSLDAARLAVETWTAQPQADDAVNVKAPPGGWDATASAAPAKPKPQQPLNVKPQAQSAKIN
jgi:localization factor PodJL